MLHKAAALPPEWTGGTLECYAFARGRLGWRCSLPPRSARHTRRPPEEHRHYICRVLAPFCGKKIFWKNMIRGTLSKLIFWVTVNRVTVVSVNRDSRPPNMDADRWEEAIGIWFLKKISKKNQPKWAFDIDYSIPKAQPKWALGIDFRPRTLLNLHQVQRIIKSQIE
jgi:hypothetical protein